MGLISRTAVAAGDLITSLLFNTQLDTVYNLVNGGLDTNNISAIAESKITFAAAGHAHSGGAGGAPTQLVVGTSIASAASITIPTDGNCFAVTGTTGITALGTRNTGVLAILKFSGSLLLTHNATTLILADAKNLQTAAGDIVAFYSEGAGNWRELWRLRPRTIGAWGVRGNRSKNNAGTPNTKVDLIADVVLLQDSAGGILRLVSPATVTQDISLDNTNINGRDQAGAFSASSWIHVYWVYDGTTLKSRSSVTAPPTGPTLATGETHWAYAGAWRYNATPLLVPARALGETVYYDTQQQALTAGAATVETALDLAAFIPPGAHSILLHVYASLRDTRRFHLRVVTTADYFAPPAFVVGAGVDTVMPVEVPNVGQSIFYLVDGGGGSGTVAINILGYRLPVAA